MNGREIIEFWARLDSADDDETPRHLPIGVDSEGNGPRTDDAYQVLCWCGETDCPLNAALENAHRLGVRRGKELWLTMSPREIWRARREMKNEQQVSRGGDITARRRTW